MNADKEEVVEYLGCNQESALVLSFPVLLWEYVPFLLCISVLDKK